MIDRESNTDMIHESKLEQSESLIDQLKNKQNAMVSMLQMVWS
jgi:hypothetical protein